MKILKSLLQIGTSTGNTSPTLARLKTIEGCDAYLSELAEQASAINPELEGGQAGKLLIARKMEEVNRARSMLELEAERKRVVDAVAQKKAEATSAIDAAKKRVDAAAADFEAAANRLESVQGRVSTLSAQMDTVNQALMSEVEIAEKAFQHAVSTQAGDEAENAASAALLAARKALGSADEPASLRMRLGALRGELDTVTAASCQAQQVLDDAKAAWLSAVAALRLVEYDEQAQALLDSFARADVAFRAANNRALLDMAGVNQPIVQFSNTGHVVFGGRLTVHNNRTLSERAVQNLAIPAVRLDVLDTPLPVM